MKSTMASIHFLLLMALSGLAPLAVRGAGNLAITHVNVIDATGAPLRTNVTLLIAEGRIRSMGASSEIRAPADAIVVDATGKFVIPGLWDMHVHWYERETLSLFIANGVTGIRMMLGYPMHHEWRAEIDTGTLIGPRMWIGSMVIDGPRPIWSGTLSAGSAEEGIRMVTEIRATGADFVKVYSLLPREAFLAVAEECRKQGLPFLGHVPEMVSAADASNQGQRSFEHLLGIARACSSREAELTRLAEKAIESFRTSVDSYEILRPELRRLGRLALDSFSREKAEALFAILKRNQTWQCPTLLTLRNTSHLGDPAITNDTRVRFMSQSIRSSWNPANDFRHRSMSPEDIVLAKADYGKQLELLGAMHRAGVPILAGTDALNPYAFPGFSLHDELALLVQAGLKPMEALQTATLNAARVMDREKDLGTIEPGKLADLVLLDANPLEDISHTRKIHAVVFGGRVFPKGELATMLSEVEALRTNPKVTGNE
jgi:imidazolonepropionase-like amidohydrolase